MASFYFSFSSSTHVLPQTTTKKLQHTGSHPLILHQLDALLPIPSYQFLRFILVMGSIYAYFLFTCTAIIIVP